MKYSSGIDYLSCSNAKNAEILIILLITIIIKKPLEMEKNELLFFFFFCVERAVSWNSTQPVLTNTEL